MAERAKPTFLVPAQQMRIQKSGKAFLGRHGGRLGSGNYAEYVVDRVTRLRSGQVWNQVTGSKYLSQMLARREIRL